MESAISLLSWVRTVTGHNRNSILSILGRHHSELRALGVRSLGLFGSAVRNELRPDSDLDFVVEFANKSFDCYMELKFLLEDTFDRKIDLVLAGSIKPALRERILSETIYVQGL
jgi:predicted nucleotidyltransferase